MKRKIRHESKMTFKAGTYSLFLLLFSFFISNELQAQVTIGSDIPPAIGALLDLKQQTGEETSTKGIIFPRVKLVSQSSLEPLVKSATATEKTSHKGVVVYNITISPTEQLEEGLYYWNGNEWINAQNDTNAWKLTGNAGTDSDKNFLGTFDNHPLVLKTNNKERMRLSAEGDLYITNAKELANSQVLVRNDQGKVGLASVIPAKIMLVQSELEQDYPAQSEKAVEFNKGGLEHAFAVRWYGIDKETNNIVDDKVFSADNGTEEFTIEKEGNYELSGFILYKPSCRLKINTRELDEAIFDLIYSFAGVNVAIQLKKENWTEWLNIAASRQVWGISTVSNVANSVVVPPTARHLDMGDKIRMVFYRPDDGWGLPHGESGRFGICVANGINVRKGLKIVGIN
ncbi:MAG: hypothetical protein LBH58_02100 [Tannerellaceae bacterium]|jgi:hypothetical protein|nr:hypothetical protein [Tannerellaceae bacterium]